MGWAPCQEARATLPTLTIPVMEEEEEEQKDNRINIDNELPEGMTDREIDSLFNEWAVRNFISEEECDPKNVNPDFPDSVIASRLSRLPVVMEMPFNPVVRQYIDRYATRLRRSVSIMLGASNFYTPIFEEALESYQIPLELKYLPIIESALNPSATSRMGAAGLWQFMIGTAKNYNLEVTSLVDERRDPIKASYAAAHYLKDLYNIFGNWTLCIAAYNCGPGNVTKAIKRAGGETDFWTIYPYLPGETRGYVPAFIAANYIMTYYCDHNICPMKTKWPIATDTVMVSRNLHMDQVAALCGIDKEDLHALNPQYVTDVIPGLSEPCALRMPCDKILAFIDAKDSVYNYRADELLTRRATVAVQKPEPAAQRTTKQSSRTSGGKTVTVRPGDTLSAIAKRNRTTVAKLRRLNGMRSDRLKPGQRIRVK